MRVALALLVPFLSLLVVFTTPTTAQAWASTPTPVQLAGAMKSPPARIISWTPQGRAVMLAVGVGMLAYQTKDSWWPTVRGWFPNFPPEPAMQWGTHKLYEIGDQGRTVACKGSDPVIAKKITTSGNLINWNGLTYGFRQSCVGPYEYPNYEMPSVSISSVSLCRNISTNGLTYRAGQVGRNGGGLGTKVNGAAPVAKTLDIVLEFPISVLCQGNTNEVPVQSWFGLGSPTNSLAVLPLSDLGGVNSGAPEAKDWGQSASVRCRKDDGTFVTISDTMWGNDQRMGMPSCAAQVPGSIPWDGTVTHGPRATPTSTAIQPGAATTLGTFATDQTLFEEWRDCFGPTGVTCKTEVWVDGERCTIGRSICTNWSHVYRAEPERVQCRFGSHVVKITDCNPLRRAYGDRTVVVNSPEVATEIDTSVDTEVDAPPAPNPSASPSPSPTANPTPNPSAPPTTGPNPEVPAPAPPTPETNPDSRSCYGDAWSWNPIDWVYVPVKCALKWAFVPRQSVLNGQINGLKDDLDGSTIGNYTDVITGMVPAGASGCEGPAVRMSTKVEPSHPLSACSGAGASLASTSRLVLTISIGLGAAFACVRILGRGFGWDPGLGGDRSA